ncbi:MAG: AAA family ATPase [Butyricimonas virosa]|nr:AAA family ATPase [Butyricimonas virosa]
MLYQKLSIDNFLCFDHFDIQFAPGVSIIIGRNGAGKTTLIRAMVYSLYFMFTNDRSMGDDFLSAGNPDLKMKSIKYDEFHRRKDSEDVTADANFHGQITFQGENIEWDMYRRSTSGSSLNPSRYKPAYQHLMHLYRTYDELPLLAYFSDSFPHTLTNISSFAKQQMVASGKTLRNFGYYQWDNETACVEIWQRRLLNSMAKLGQLDDDTDIFTRNEVAFVTKKLTQFSLVLNRDICDTAFEIDRLFYLFDEEQKPELWLRLKSEQEIKFDRLPAGYKRLYSIVLDLAYRAYLLNRRLDVEPTGLVMIDEIDLHLHPSLETEIVKRFTQTFPKLQFIMTSHSPLIVSNLSPDEKQNKIFRLVAGEKQPHELPDLFGIDYDDVLLDWMGGTPRNEELEFLRMAIKRAVQMENTQLFNMRRKELEKMLGENQASQLINKWKEE